MTIDSLSRAPTENDHVNNDDERVNSEELERKNEDSTSISEQSKKRTRPQNITDRTTARSITPRRKRSGLFLYCFKPPFPSGGGCAAASAGRGDGLRPSC